MILEERGDIRMVAEIVNQNCCIVSKQFLVGKKWVELESIGLTTEAIDSLHGLRLVMRGV